MTTTNVESSSPRESRSCSKRGDHLIEQRQIQVLQHAEVVRVHVVGMSVMVEDFLMDTDERDAGFHQSSRDEQARARRGCGRRLHGSRRVPDSDRRHRACGPMSASRRLAVERRSSWRPLATIACERTRRRFVRPMTVVDPTAARSCRAERRPSAGTAHPAASPGRSVGTSAHERTSACRA